MRHESMPEGEERVNSASDNLPWFAVQVRTTHEKRVAAMLGYKGYQWLLPLYKTRRRWSDRVKQMEVPLFGGYVFCRFNPDACLNILKTPSVLRIVGTSRSLTPVDNSEIAALQRIVQSTLPAQPFPFLQVGNKVCINGGPLDGLEGLVVNVKSNYRLVLSVSLLQRSLAVEIDSAWVSPANALTRRPSIPYLFSGSGDMDGHTNRDMAAQSSLPIRIAKP